MDPNTLDMLTMLRLSKDFWVAGEVYQLSDQAMNEARGPHASHRARWYIGPAGTASTSTPLLVVVLVLALLPFLVIILIVYYSLRLATRQPGVVQQEYC